MPNAIGARALLVGFAFNSRFKSEGRSMFLAAQSVTELAETVAEWMDYYNAQRRHSRIDYLPPLTYIERIRSGTKECARL